MQNIDLPSTDRDRVKMLCNSVDGVSIDDGRSEMLSITHIGGPNGHATICLIQEVSR